MNKKGFTLVETLVAIAIFAIVVLIGVGGFANALHTQGEVSSLIAAQSNASIALEQMAREIRTGYLFCDTSPNTGGTIQLNSACSLVGIGQNQTGCSQTGSDILTCKNIIDFYDAQGYEVDYALAPGGGVTSAGALERNQAGNGYEPITSDNVTLKYLTFTIFGTTEGDNWPPRITISMGVVASSTDPAVANDVINLQTTVSARNIDCTQTTPQKC
jgi:prepilin-type N-terminal cleavage/methylation domain-containing protein